jgi:sulfite reductase (NADPH) flavoprotein alpha-component
MTHLAPLLPDNAPFGTDERAWLNGWLAGYFARASEAAIAPAVPLATEPAGAPEEYPWHDMTMPLVERVALAEGRPLARRLMAAMAQQDCGQCGYLCKSYAEAIASGAEKSFVRCVPGGKETARALKELMELATIPPVAGTSQPLAAHAITAPDARPAPSEIRFARAARLNGERSAKDTRHVVLEWSEKDLTYEVGDSLGVHATNCAEVVAAIIEQLGARAADDVDCPDGTRRSLAEALSVVCDIGRPTDEAVEVLASRARDIGESQRLQALAEGYPGAQPEGADLLDLLLAFPSARPPLQELISALGVLQPRLYSIACSPKQMGGSVHLTVAAVRWEQRGRLRKGIASTFLADRAVAGEAIPVFVQPSAFRLPSSSDAPIIMIGPGTGVAPFRAFLQERRAIGARGRNWLFFGDQHAASDFLYQEELAAYRHDGLLTRLDLAFSRDQPERTYVQQCMRDRGAELWAWLREGAYLYVCGAAAMGRDVDAALAAIVARQGAMTGSAAKSYLATLAREGRYQRDVY